MRGSRWTAADVLYLEKNWGEKGADKIAEDLKRTRVAVESMAAKRGLGSPNRGRMTVRGISKEFGYDRIRVIKACEHLGVSLQRAKVGIGVTRSRVPGRRQYIPEDSLGKLLSFLAQWPDGERMFSRKGRKTSVAMWGTGGKPACCRCCDRADVPHRLMGWCVHCANREYKRERRARQTVVLPQG